MIDTQKTTAGATVFVMKDNKPVETKIRAINRFERFKHNKVENKTEVFVEGVEREVAAEELFSSVEDCVSSLLPPGTKLNSQDSVNKKS